MSETAQAPSNVVPAPPVATGEPEADPEGILSTDDFVDWKEIKKHLAVLNLEVFDKAPDEDSRNYRSMRRSQTPATSSVAPEATTTAAHDEL